MYILLCNVQHVCAVVQLGSTKTKFRFKKDHIIRYFSGIFQGFKINKKNLHVTHLSKNMNLCRKNISQKLEKKVYIIQNDPEITEGIIISGFGWLFPLTLETITDDDSSPPVQRDEVKRDDELKKVTVIDTDSCGMTVCRMPFPFQEEVWCWKHLATSDRCWC